MAFSPYLRSVMVRLPLGNLTNQVVKNTLKISKYLIRYLWNSPVPLSLKITIFRFYLPIYTPFKALNKLLHIYSLIVQSSTEYCSVAWHDSLTQQQSKAIERLQHVALKIILGKDSPIKVDKHIIYIGVYYHDEQFTVISYGNKASKGVIKTNNTLAHHGSLMTVILVYTAAIFTFSSDGAEFKRTF